MRRRRKASAPSSATHSELPLPTSTISSPNDFARRSALSLPAKRFQISGCSRISFSKCVPSVLKAHPLAKQRGGFLASHARFASVRSLFFLLRAAALRPRDVPEASEGVHAITVCVAGIIVERERVER